MDINKHTEAHHASSKAKYIKNIIKRQKLNIKILLEYNNRDDIRNKINIFKCKLINYKKSIS